MRQDEGGLGVRRQAALCAGVHHVWRASPTFAFPTNHLDPPGNLSGGTNKKTQGTEESEEWK